MGVFSKSFWFTSSGIIRPRTIAFVVAVFLFLFIFLVLVPWWTNRHEVPEHHSIMSDAGGAR